jgi:ribosomal protein S18 acetylase RimI-like enzyme
MDNLEFRQGTKGKKEWLWTLYRSTLKEHVDNAWGWDENFQFESFNKYLRVEEFCLIYQNNKPVGGYLLQDKKDHYWLEMILIDAKHQNKGIGTKVICDILKQNCSDIKPLEFNVIKGNRAIELYKRLGFHVYDEDDNFYKMTMG